MNANKLRNAKKIIPLWIRDWYVVNIKRPPCVGCDSRVGELQLENGAYICGMCAQIQGELSKD